MPLPLSAGITRFPYGISSFGMPVIGAGGLMTTGNVWFVGSTASGSANDASHGLDPITPFKTIAYAMSKCTANQGDVVFVMEGHNEAITGAGSLTFSAAGVRVIGLGIGRNRPTLTISTAGAASIAVNAANCILQNVVITLTTTDGLTGPLDINATDFSLLGCEILFASATAQAVTTLITDSNASRLLIDDCRFIGTDTAGATSVIQIGGTPDSIQIRNCTFIGRATSGLIWNETGNVATNLLIENNYCRGYSATPGIVLVSASTGVIRRNALASTTLTGILDPGACAAYENYGYDTSVPDVQGVPIPVVGTELGAGRSLVDELLGASINEGRTNTFSVTVDLTSATWNIVATHTIAAVTGAVRLRILPICTDTLTSGGPATVQYGHASDTTAYVDSTVFSAVTTGTLWLTQTPEVGATWASVIDVVSNGQSVGYEILTAALTGGGLVFHVWWEPLDSTGAVVAGDGSAL